MSPEPLTNVTVSGNAASASQRSRFARQQTDDERTDEAKVLEHLRPQLARDAAYFVERPADGLPGLVELLAVGRCALGDRVEL